MPESKSHFLPFLPTIREFELPDPPKNMLIAMGLSAVLCVFIGSYPWLLYQPTANACGLCSL